MGELLTFILTLFGPIPVPAFAKYLSRVLKSFNFCGYVTVVGNANHLLFIPDVFPADQRNGCGACKRYFSCVVNFIGSVEFIMSYPEKILKKSKLALTTTSGSTSCYCKV